MNAPGRRIPPLKPHQKGGLDLGPAYVGQILAAAAAAHELEGFPLQFLSLFRKLAVLIILFPKIILQINS